MLFWLQTAIYAYLLLEHFSNMPRKSETCGRKCSKEPAESFCNWIFTINHKKMQTLHQTCHYLWLWSLYMSYLCDFVMFSTLNKKIVWIKCMCLGQGHSWGLQGPWCRLWLRATRIVTTFLPANYGHGLGSFHYQKLIFRKVWKTWAGYLLILFIFLQLECTSILNVCSIVRKNYIFLL